MQFVVPKVAGNSPPIRALIMRLRPTRTRWESWTAAEPLSPALGRWDLNYQKGYAALVFDTNLQESGLAGKVFELFEHVSGEPPRLFGSEILVAGPELDSIPKINAEQWTADGPPSVVRAPFLNLNRQVNGRQDRPDAPRDPGCLLQRLAQMLKEHSHGWSDGRKLANQLVMWEVDAWSKHGAENAGFLRQAYDQLINWVEDPGGLGVADWAEPIGVHYNALLPCRQLFSGVAIERLTECLLERGRQLCAHLDQAPQAVLAIPEEAILGAVAKLLSSSFRFWLGDGPLHPPHAHPAWKTDAAFELFSHFASGRLRTYNRCSSKPSQWTVIGGQPDGSYFALFAQLGLAVLETPVGRQEWDLWVPLLGGALAAQSQFYSVYGPNSLQGGRMDFGPKNLLSPHHYRDKLVRAEALGWPTIVDVDQVLADESSLPAFLGKARTQLGANETYVFGNDGLSTQSGPPPWRVKSIWP